VCGLMHAAVHLSITNFYLHEERYDHEKELRQEVAEDIRELLHDSLPAPSGVDGVLMRETQVCVG
jgi:hypothetical protein